jgi:hypothetical protein
METLGNKIAAFPPFKFFCELCDYKTSHKSHYDDHLVSSRHSHRKQMETNGNKIGDKASVPSNICKNCSKEFSTRSGLWKHKQKCKNNINNDTNTNTNNNMINGLTEQLVIELIKQNKELLEIVKNGTNITNTNITGNTTNSHNKAFNLQFFLNETCKDAMNIGDFVDSLKIQLDDLEKVGETGYIQGISNIIVKNLKALDITKRPVHCTDKKRETVYIKDEDKWEKDEDKSKMHKLIKRVVSKNVKMFAKFREAHPDCTTYHSKFSDQYNKIIYESMGGKGDDDFEKNEKIIKNVLKQVVVDKGSESEL